MRIGYIALCLLVPLLWGLASTRLFDWWQARSRSHAATHPAPDEPDAPTAAPMYHI